MATWTTQREKNLFEQYIKPTLTPLNGIENKLITVANDLIKNTERNASHKNGILQNNSDSHTEFTIIDFHTRFLYCLLIEYEKI